MTTEARPVPDADAIPAELPEEFVAQVLADAEAFMVAVAEGGPLPEIAERRTLETVIAFERKRLTDELEDVEARAATIARAFAAEASAIRLRILQRDAVLEELLRIRVMEGGPKTKKSLRVPGAGTLKLTKTGGGWSVKDDAAAMAWLEKRGLLREEFLRPRALSKKALLARREAIMLYAGGEFIDGVERSPDGQSFKFNPEGAS